MTSYLIIKLGAIGDVAMATAIASELRKSTPAVQITWVVGRAAKPLLEATNIVDEIITADEDPILSGSLSQKISAVWSVVSKLGMRKFDVCLIPYRDWRYHILRAGVRCKEERTFCPDRWLIPGRYHGFEYARLALGRDLAADENITLPAAQLAPYSGEKVPAILLAPGSPSPTATDRMRQWPLDSYVQLAQMLCEQGHAVGIVGIDNTGKLEKEFQNLPVVSFINRTTIPELLQVLGQAQMLVTHDTGTMHLMEICGGACVALFGPTIASEKLFPSSRNLALQSPALLPCMPCYDGRNYAECNHRRCMRNITPQRVFQAVRTYMEKSSHADNAGEKS